MDYIGFKVPDGLALTAVGAPFKDGAVLASDRCTISLQLAPVGAHSCSAPPDASGRSLQSFGLDTIGRGQDRGTEHIEPRRYDRGEPPQPDVADLLGQRDEDAEQDEHEAVEATFLILAPRFQCEQVLLSLRVPATVGDVLDELASACTAGFLIYLDKLVPAYPQPDVSFGSLVAYPAWSQDCACALVDSRQLDNRLFVHVFPLRLNRSSVILHLFPQGVEAVRIFLRGLELTDPEWYDFYHGDTVLILPAGGQPSPPVRFADMLRDTHDWISPCPIYGGPHFPAFCVLSDGGCKVVLVDVDSVRSFSDFRRLAATELQYRSGQVLVSSSQPRVSDLEVPGQYCKAILVATEHVLRIQIPPGRLSMLRTIAFVDRRCLLQSFTWVVAEQGLLDLDRFLEPYHAEAPAGYSASLTGAPTELRCGRPFLRIAQGTHLTITYVWAESSVSGPSSDSGDSSSTSHPDSELNDSSEHGPLDTPHHPVFDGQQQRRNSSSDRSRSPRPGRSPTGTDRCEPHSKSFSPLRGAHDEVPIIVDGDPAAQLDTLTSGDCPLFDSPKVCSGFIPSCGPRFFELVVSVEVLPAFLPKNGIVACKLLLEPPSGSPALDDALAGLRYVASRLGRSWRYLPPGDATAIASDSGEESASEDAPVEPSTMHFNILTPGYQAVRLALCLQLPVTWPEVENQLQTHRVPEDTELHPHLIPAEPQPCPGSGVVIALPAWYHSDPNSRPCLCFDTSTIDGRLFAAACPAYVSRRHLLHIADLFGVQHVSVHVCGDPIPLSDTAQCHVAPGDTVVFVPSAAVVLTLLT